MNRPPGLFFPPWILSFHPGKERARQLVKVLRYKADDNFIQAAGGQVNWKNLTALALVFFLLLILTACVPGPKSAEKTPDEHGQVAGFISGLWHGFISPVTYIVSLFSKNIRIYEVHNNGGWYNFGFVLGAGLFLQGGILGGRKARKK